MAPRPRTELDHLPDLTGLLAGAARASLPWSSLGGDGSATGVPDVEVAVHDVEITLDQVADYADVCGFLLRDHVPVTQPHLLGFPLVVWLLTRPDFPYALLGLVHVANHVTAHTHLSVGDHVDVSAHVADVRPHEKGVQFDAVVRVSRDGQLAWESASTYLRRGPVPDDVTRGDPDDTDEPPDDMGLPDPGELPLTARWSLDADLGRRYGAVSGDRNPIHLSALSAKAFGFPRAIAHGMWTTAAALAALGELPRPCTVDVAFKRPVLLPGRAELVTRRDEGGDERGDGGGGWSFGLRSRDGIPHLAGRVRAG